MGSTIELPHRPSVDALPRFSNLVQGLNSSATTDVLIRFGCFHEPKETCRKGRGTKLTLSVDGSLDTLDTAIGFHVFDDFGMEFLNKYVAFKRLEAKQASEKTEQ